MRQTKMDKLNKKLSSDLQDYVDHLAAISEKPLDQMGLRGIVDGVVYDMVADIQDKSPERLGDYVKGWTDAPDSKNTVNRYFVNTYNDSKRPRNLMWLLENGHVVKKADGTFSWAQAIPHVMPAYNKARRDLKKEIYNAFKL